MSASIAQKKKRLSESQKTRKLWKENEDTPWASDDDDEQMIEGNKKEAITTSGAFKVSSVRHTTTPLTPLFEKGHF